MFIEEIVIVVINELVLCVLDREDGGFVVLLKFVCIMMNIEVIEGSVV